MAKGKLGLMMQDPIAEINGTTEENNIQPDQAQEQKSETPPVVIDENKSSEAENITSPRKSNNSKSTKSKKLVKPLEQNFNVVKVFEETYFEIKKALVTYEHLKGVKIQEFVNEAISEKLDKLKKRGS